jgi:hypothetical protein
MRQDRNAVISSSFASSGNLWKTICAPLHGGGQGFESPRLHSKYIDLQVKHEGWVEAPDKLRGLVLQLILQRVFRGAICAVQQGALLAKEQEKITAERIDRRGPRGSVLQAALMAVYLSPN